MQCNVLTKQFNIYSGTLFKQNSFALNKNDFSHNFNVPFQKDTYISFKGNREKYNIQNDIQLNNIRKNYKSGNAKISFNDKHTDDFSKKILKDFLTGNDEKINVKRILGSNGTTYIVANKKTPKNKIVVKAQHIPQDGRYPSMITRWNYAEFYKEKEMLKMLPEKINSTKIIADITINEPEKREMLVITYVEPRDLLQNVPNALTKEKLGKLYNDFLKLDENKIYHRDLNATNIMVEKNTNDLYILDYGAGQTFNDMHELNNQTNKIVSALKIENQTPNKNNEKIDELTTKLIKNIKYKIFDGLELSNLNNFEYLGLLPALMIMSTKLPLTNSKRTPNKLDKLFLEHLKLAGNYHQKRLELLDKNSIQYKNEEILASILSKIDTNSDNTFTNDVANLELSRIKMEFANKITRLYTTSDNTNYKIASYWVQEFGGQAQNYIQTSKQLLKKYKNDKLMSDYLKLNMQIGNFYRNEIYPVMQQDINKNSLKYNTSDTITMKQDRTVLDGHWIEHIPKEFAPSFYSPKAQNERIKGMFDFY